MAEVKKARLFLRRGTDTDRKTTTLCEGELGYSTDAFRVVIGDGSTAGGRSASIVVHVSGGTLGANFQTNLTQASSFPGTGGFALSGDMAVFPHQSYTNAKGDTVTIGSGNVGAPMGATVMMLTGSNAAVNTSWVPVNSGIPWGNLSVQDDDISGDKIYGGTISGPITVSGGNVHIGGNGISENLILSGTYLSAATLPTGDLVYPVGLTSAATLTCIDSIFGFGETSTSSVGTDSGYVKASNTTAASAVSAYIKSNGAYTFSGTSSNSNLSAEGTPQPYGASSGIDMFSDYVYSGGAYATGTGQVLFPGGWDNTGVAYKSAFREYVYDIGLIRNAMAQQSLTFNMIKEFYFQVYHTHYDDAGSFIGFHNHLTDNNQVAHWNSSSIKSGKMRNTAEVEHVTIPNTVNTSEAASQQALVIHLGINAKGRCAYILTGLRVNV